MGYYMINVFCLCRFVVWCCGLLIVESNGGPAHYCLLNFCILQWNGLLFDKCVLFVSFCDLVPGALCGCVCVNVGKR